MSISKASTPMPCSIRRTCRPRPATDCHGNHGAFPPQVKSIALVCRQCHPSTGELSPRAPTKRPSMRMGISECEACHGNHKILRPSDDMLGTGKGAVCIQCHESGSKGYQAASDLGRHLRRPSNANINGTKISWPWPKRKASRSASRKFHLRDVNTILVSARNLTHGLAVADISQKAAEGRRSWPMSGRPARRPSRRPNSGGRAWSLPRPSSSSSAWPCS